MNQTNNVKNPAQQLLLSEYAKEILPKFRMLATKTQIIKEWADEDATVAKYKASIKAEQDALKAYIEEVEAELVREIKDLKTDIGLACKAASKGSEYEAKDLKAYFKKRSEDKVEDVIEKGNIFESLNSALL